MDTSPLRYLSAADVMAAMPDIETRLELGAKTMVALVDDAQLPPKIGVYPGPVESFAHAMPAWMRGAAGDGSEDLLGIKWVASFPANASAGLPNIHGTAILSDATTGLPRAVMDAGGITAQRTAAVSGAAIARWGPQPDVEVNVAIIGAGVQARSHLPIIAHLLPGAAVTLCDRDAERLGVLAAEVEAGRFGSIGSVATTTDRSAAVVGAALVLTMVSFGAERQSIPETAFAVDATVVAVDYDMCVPSPLASGASLFLTDDQDQFEANHTDVAFVGYPPPMAMIGEAITAQTPRPPGRVLIFTPGRGSGRCRLRRRHPACRGGAWPRHHPGAVVGMPRSARRKLDTPSIESLPLDHVSSRESVPFD